jgi:hypothetical protein
LNKSKQKIIAGINKPYLFLRSFIAEKSSW